MIKIKTCYQFTNGTLVFDCYVAPVDITHLEVEDEL